MIAALTYVPRPTALGRAGAGAATVYLLALALACFLTSNPIVMAGIGGAIVVAGTRAGAGRALALSLRWGLALGILIVAVNAIAAQRGETILVRGPVLPVLGPIDVSAEALLEGGVLAARVVLVIAVFSIHSACVDPDRLLRLLRPLARRSALTAALVTRLVPLAARDHERLSEAARLRGPGAAPVGRAAMLRRLVAGSLDRAVDAAAALELRGYSASAPGRPSSGRGTPRDAAFLATGLAITGGLIGARLLGVADFDAYPTVRMSAGPATLACAAALPLLAGAPFALDRARRDARRRRRIRLARAPGGPLGERVGGV